MYLVAGGRGLAGCGHLLVSLLGLLLLLARSGTRALVCLPCDESKCEEPRNCPGSIVQGVCGCCYTCASQRNESCGGTFGIYGTCDRGLRCVIRPPLNGDSLTEYEAGVCEVFGVDCRTVECPPVQQTACPPDSYETQVRLTADGCCTLPTRCECLSGLCGFPMCEVGSTPRIVSRGDGTPGKCCDVFECVNDTKPACVFNNVEYYDGDMFRMDNCRFCRCQGGVAICFTAQCGEINCERYYVPEGECCPVCEDPVYPFNNPAGCYANGLILAHGDRWREDDCTFCQCVNGERHCVATVCGQTCTNPVKVPGECCPVCEEPTIITVDPPACGELSNCTLTGKDCINGFKRDHNGCRTCQCINSEELCSERKQGCTLDCPFGFLTDAQNCEVCECRTRPKKCRPIICDKYCPLGLLKNKHGCDICRCKKCPELSCSKICPLGFQQDSHGCLTCKCREFSASAGPPILSGTCLTVDGHHHKNEESWHDGCRECYCLNGREMCALITCPVPACGNPTIHPGQCCPSCADDFVVQKPELSTPSICHAPGGEYFVEGETWNIDSCTQCTCHSGRVLCETEVCPPLLCQNPSRTQDSCCPQCTDQPFRPALSRNNSVPNYCKNDEGDIFLAAESWKPDVCTSCICIDSVISCFSESCPSVSCERPVLRKGQCCPYCIEDTIPKKVVCHFSGKAYADEERWDLDSCTHCYCLQGQTLCSTVSCPPLPCVEPINVEGSCCPMCPEMYVPEPTNIPIEKTNHRGEVDLEVPLWPTPSENDIIHLPRDMGHLQVDYRDNRLHPSEDSSLDSIASVVAPIIICLSIIIAFLFINQKKQWIPLLCWYRTPTKPSSLNNQLVSVDCKKGTRVQVDSSQRMLRIAEPDARFSGFYSMQKQNHLQADNFYQTV
ncbi:cysteine-rich motor neuron 1 protein isoform X4 [Hylobates moloch]|uniref:cysteine-rich motor neuron 1 protein isoform X4 n=1 Tax=Hylobates moloch TaxID=81572 RepID=UPI001361FB86|nr:cysteine-rich motor neuron 1 protein isoform X4 [Hylobates moloch]